MTDDLQQPLPELQFENFPIAPEEISQRPKKANKKLWLIAGGAIVIGISCLCLIICIATSGLGLGSVLKEKAPIESVLDSYMKYMAAKEVDNAYALFSPRAQRQIPISKIHELIEGNNYFVFEGYQSLSVQNLNISAVANVNPDMPQGTVAKVTGTIIYESDIQGTFNATLEKVDDQWQLDSVYVTVPPSKFSSD